MWPTWVTLAICPFFVTSALAQTPQPFPRGGAQPPAPAPAQPAPPRAPAPAVVPPAPPPAAPDPATPTEATLGFPIYPGAQFIASYDAGRAQRYYIFGATASFNTVITGSMISIIPLILAFTFLQRYWQSGLGSGGVKG